MYCRKMKKDGDILTFSNNSNNIGYTSDGDRTSERDQFFMTVIPRKIAKNEAGIEDKSDDLQGEGVKIIIPSNIIDIWRG